MERLLAEYLGSCLGVRVKDVEVVVQDNGNGSLAVHLGLKTVQPLYGAPARYGSLVVRSVEHEMVSRWEVGKATPTQVPDGSVVNLSAVSGAETAEVFRLLAEQFEVTK